jgi:pimeloyl-ACP methyl ester carboxylesterase
MINHVARCVAAFVGCVTLAVAVLDAGAADVKTNAAAAARVASGERHSTWEGFERLDFTVAGRAGLLVVPRTPAPGKPWIWRTEFFGAFPAVDIALLKKGYHVAYLDVQNLYGAPVALWPMDVFYAHLTNVYHLAPKTVPEGFSRGGLFAFNWAARNPDKVAAIYVDAPVCDFKSWPGGKGKGKGSPEDWLRCKNVYGLTEEQALAYRLNPVDNLKPIAAAKIPVVAVVGDADSVVPIAENMTIVEKRYRELGGDILVIHKPGVEHHPHSLEDPTPVLDYLIPRVNAALK